jgi:hypothetical protein
MYEQICTPKRFLRSNERPSTTSRLAGQLSTITMQPRWLTFYRILGTLNHLLALFMMFSAFTQVFAGGLNTSVLLSLFVVVSTLLYASLSNQFTRQVVLRGQTLRTKTKDWIRVNGIVAAIAALVQIGGIGWVLLNPAVRERMAENLPKEALPWLKGVSIFALCYAISIITHFILTLKLLRTYRHQFNDDVKEQQ